MHDEDVSMHRAESWGDLQDLLYLDSWQEDIGRHRSPYVYRGLSNKEYHLENMLRRFVGDSDRWELETHLLRGFNKYVRQERGEPQSIWELLSIAQHHGLPTRLFDWTYSPLVAAYFATKHGRVDHDAVIWAVDYEKVHETLPEPYQNILDNEHTSMFDIQLLVRGDFEMARAMGKDVTEEYVRSAHESVVFRLEEVRQQLIEFSSRPEGGIILFFEPPAIDDRIINQSALFSYQTDPTVLLDEWLKERPELYRKIIIPAELKPEVRDKLYQANVNPRTLFGGLDGLASWLTEYYRPQSSKRVNESRRREP